MRQGHQNRRGRNRNNGNARKGQNPVTRSYESNGPDMKIRGTPAHIAEKYLALSRDAQSNGDPVLSENYLQHAEHYNRIILAYRDTQAQQASEQPNGAHAGNGHQRPAANQEQPQISDAEFGDGDSPRSASAGQQQTRRSSRGGRDRNSDNRTRQERGQRGRKPHVAADASEQASSRNEQGGSVPEHEQPEFLRRSIRRPRREAADQDGEAAVKAAADDSAQD